MQGIWTIALLAVSNIFMTFAWYGHLKFKSSPLWIAIGVSWLIALLEYCFQVPANRFGSAYFSTAELKVMQEVITLLVFGAFSVLYLKEQFRWNYLVAFVLIVGAVFFVFAGGNDKSPHEASINAPAPAVVTNSVSVTAVVE
ncbi:MAG: DMT family protein [Candidatus Obscuribacter sp.]|nr:DMT family protein [Candidatus Obscuribacter sp.]MBP6593692.1 DMT family protein [Candidatus Obscuribacter sp.]MBP7576691.1 DMT family protein [Candidatus Obscuribacter sp.]